MSFVFGKAKRQSPFKPNCQIPSPNLYHKQQQNIEQGTAPFNSSSLKRSSFDIIPSNVGPGSYDINNLKIFQKSKKISSSFVSKVDRFSSKQNEIINQITTNNQQVNQKQIRTNKINQKLKQSKNKMSTLRKDNNHRNKKSSSTQQFDRIILSNPHNTQITQSIYVQKTINPKTNGVGSYYLTNQYKSKNIIDWSKTQSKRFKKTKNQNPGPGQYQSNMQPIKRYLSLSAAFAYQGVRSHLDQFIYRTKMPFKIKVIQQKNLKDRYPGPGTYNPNKTSSKSFNYGTNNFGSIKTQPTLEKQHQVSPGPGYYQNKYDKNFQKITKRQQLKKNRQKIFTKKQKHKRIDTLYQKNAQQIKKHFINQMNKNQNKFYTLKQRCSSKNGNFAQSQRFKLNNTNNNPGPCDYSIFLKKQNSQRKKSNKLNQKHQSQQLQQNQTKIPFYQIDKFDMGKKAARVKRNIQNLKQIDILKAPFNIKQKRFSSKQYINKQETIIQTDFGQNFKQQNNRYSFKQRIYARNKQNSIFISKSKRLLTFQQSQSLGPGSYSYSDNIQKKSFNKEYNYKAPQKIKPTKK